MLHNAEVLQLLVIEDNLGDFVLIKEYINEVIKNPVIVHQKTFGGTKEILSKKHSFNAILLDLTLPDNSGEKLVKEMVRLAGNIPVIVLTGYEDKGFGFKTLSLGISDYLFKDELSPSMLIKSISYSVERKRIGNQLLKAEETKKRHQMEITKAIIHAQEKERMEIGSELHDNVNQLLLASKINLRLLRDEKDPGKVIEWLNNSSGYIDIAIEEIRNLSHRLSPRSFLRNSLKEAFNDLIENINPDKSWNIKLRWLRLEENILTDELKLNLYRILQEQIKNIKKHSRATEVVVEMDIDAGLLMLKIHDNGKGFDKDFVKPGLGLQNIKQRAELFGGRIDINSQNGSGCELVVEIPVISSNIK